MRPATSQDFEFILDLTREAFGPFVQEIWGWDEEDQRARQLDWFSRTPVQIVEADGEAVGCLAVIRHPDHVFLNRIGLAANWQRRGIGTRLIEQVLADAADSGLAVRLSVLDNNPAQGLYERLGFRVTEVVPPRIRMEWRPPG
jgi:ribosomal protein S18 acetylase RimI-like enzyme